MLKLAFTRRWLVRLAVVLVMVAVFLALGWWQWNRGLAGNARSIAYAFEWPVFALFVLFMWWKMLRLEFNESPGEGAAPQPGDAGASESSNSADASVRARQYVPRMRDDEEPDEELAAYNRYLAWLNTQDQQQHQ